MDKTRFSKRTLDQFEALTPEKRAKAEAILERIQSPAYRAKEAAAREALDREIRETGQVATRHGGITPERDIEVSSLIGVLKRAREEAGISMTEVSRRSGIDLAALSRLENGQQSNFTIATAQRYAAAIGKMVNWVLDDASNAIGRG